MMITIEDFELSLHARLSNYCTQVYSSTFDLTLSYDAGLIVEKQIKNTSD